MNDTTPPVFGIDLGTTCSAIGHLVDGHPRLIEIDGSTLTPSVVRFPANGPPIVGDTAVNQLALYPDETLRSTKRQIGSDQVWTIHGNPITPVDAATAILKTLVEGAESATGARPARVVVTVPAWFSHSARADTQAAAEAAGLEVLRLVNEPTAAALARDFETDEQRTYLVYDFGGGTFDASLIVQSGSLVEVKASNGDTQLGGDDVDEALLNRVLAKLDRDAPEAAAAIRGGRAARESALAAVREAKHALSSDLSAAVRAPFLTAPGEEPVNLDAKLDRDDLEAALAPLLERTHQCVDTVLLDAGVTAEDVDDVLLVGGTTRAAGVREALLDRYGWEGDASVPVQDAVGLGATIQAGIALDADVRATLIDVTPHALSVTAITETRMGESICSSVITPRNVSLPCRHTHRFWTSYPDQKAARTTVMQGSDPNPLRNVMLGEVEIDQLPEAPPGEVRRPIAIELSHDLSGVVSVRVLDELSGRSVDAAIALSGVESGEARERLIEELEATGAIPGDGTDPDPFCEEDGHYGGEGAALKTIDIRPAAPPTDEKLADAKRAFAQIEVSKDALARDHPDVALALRQLATRGQEALAEDRANDAFDAYEDLADLMFEAGVYL